MSEATPETMSGKSGEYAADTQALREKAARAREAVAGLAGEAKRYASSRASDVKDSAAHWAQNARSKASQIGEQTVDYVQRKPYKALVIAAGIGFLAGLLLKRR